MTWLKWIKEDFETLGLSNNVESLAENAKSKFGVELNTGNLQKRMGMAATVSVIGKGLSDETPKKPVDLRGGGRLG
jgi:hypothetical protein